MVSNVKSAATLAVIALVAVCVAGSHVSEQHADVLERHVADKSLNEAAEASKTLEKYLSEKLLYGDKVKSLNQAPYVVEILVPDMGGDYHRCTGSVVARDIVFAAAHCFGTPALSYVSSGLKGVKVCGGYYKRKPSEIFKFCVDVEAVKVPKKYVGPYYGYDLAAIKLEKPIKGTRVVTVSFKDKSPKYKARGYVRGWGAVNFGMSKYPDVLRELKVKIQPAKVLDQKCFNDDKYATYFLKVLSKGQVCHGDSGGPVVVQPWKQVNWRRHVQLGVASWGCHPNGHCKPDLPTYYSRFGHPSHASFLKKVVALWGRKLRTV